MAKHYDEVYEVVTIIHPKDVENMDYLRFYYNKAVKSKCIYRIKKFMGLKNFDIHPESMYEEVLEKFKSRKNFS